MYTACPHACTTPGCPNPTPSGKCQSCRAQSDQYRGSSTERGYDGRWRKFRKWFLRHHPLCCDPFGEHGPVLVAATVVDHIVAHKGDKELFWKMSNYSSLCRECHNQKTYWENHRDPKLPALITKLQQWNLQEVDTD